MLYKPAGRTGTCVLFVQEKVHGVGTICDGILSLPPPLNRKISMWGRCWMCRTGTANGG